MRGRRLRDCLDARQWRSIGLMAAAVVGLHLLGILLLVLVLTHRGGAVLLGTAVAAYTLGLRHAFDADHIAAIDNTTRKLMAEGKRPLSVGFWFSLGHSTVVFALAGLFALGIRSLGSQIHTSGSQLHTIGGLVGTSVSGGFLYIIAGLNLAILLGIIRLLRELRDGRYDEARLESELASRGLMNRFFGRFAAAIREPWQIYPIGVLFGLGFDTATEVALLFLAAGAAGAGLPFYAILCLPILFAAGMSLLDALDGSFMSFAYGWAFVAPARKIFYNIVITGLSVAVALVIGTIELSGLVAQRLGAQGSFWSWLENIDMGALGFIIAGVFALTWVVAFAIWRLGRVEERWSANLRSSEPART